MPNSGNYKYSGTEILTVGNLYTLEGMKYVIKNIFLCPNVNYIIFTGNDLNKIKEYQMHMRSLMFNIEGGYHQAKYKVYYINSFPEFFTKLIKEKMKQRGVTEDSSLAYINQCINEVIEIECARHSLKKQLKMKALSKSFCEAKSLTDGVKSHS